MTPQGQADESMALTEATTRELKQAHDQFETDMSTAKEASETCAMAELTAPAARAASKPTAR